MKKFQEVLKQKAHLNKIKNAKKTISASSIRGTARISSSKISQQSQLLLHLYENKNYDSIPAYKLLRTANLQQYTKGFIIRGYGINLGKLAFLNEQQKNKLYEDLKVLPGHTVKLDKIINAIVQSSYSNEDQYQNSVASSKKSLLKNQASYSGFNNGEANSGNHQINPNVYKKSSEDLEYEKQLVRVLNEYTPSISDQKRKTHMPISKIPQKKSSSILVSTQSKNQKVKYLPPRMTQVIASELKKKLSDPSTKSSIRKGTTASSKEQSHKDSLNRLLKNVTQGSMIQSNKVMEIQIDLDKYKALNRSFDGALMSSTIANLDIEELVYAFSGLVASRVIPATQPKKDIPIKLEFDAKYQDSLDNTNKNQTEIEDEVGSILRQSYLHPLYREQVGQDIQCEDALSEGQNQPEPQNQFIDNNSKNTMMESSFFGGQSFQFGLNEPIKIFQQPQPTQIDYFKPTVDSISNFIKNIVLAAKMQRQIPVMAAAYFQNFIQKSRLVLTSLNYKRLLVICLLLASKIWDDESFQTPSFSKTFPQYSTMLLNQMEKQIVKMLDYKLKLGKKQYAKIYFKLRKHIKTNIKSYQNKKLNLQKIRQLQNGARKQYRVNFLAKRTSF